MNIKIIAATFSLTALATAPAYGAAQNAYISGLYDQILKNTDYALPGHVLDSFGVLRLNQGGYGRVVLDVPAGTSIQVMGDCDKDCIDLDLVVYDAGWETLGQDNSDNDFPIVLFVSEGEGPVELEFDLVACDAPYCYAAYSVFVERN